MEEQYRQILKAIGDDPTRSELAATPRRAAEGMAELTAGYRQDPKELLKDGLFQTESEDMVVVKGIEVYSVCEHHLLPFFGRCHVGYIPQGKIIGLSRIPRIVDAYARRLQLQERLTREIAQELLEGIGAQGVGVIMEMQHLCMMSRGVEKQGATLVSSAMLGSFRSNPATRHEFLELVR